MLNLEKLLNLLSTEIARVLNEPLWISERDPEYTYGLMKLSEETSRQCNFAVVGGFQVITGINNWILQI